MKNWARKTREIYWTMLARRFVARRLERYIWLVWLSFMDIVMKEDLVKKVVFTVSGVPGVDWVVEFDGSNSPTKFYTDGRQALI